MDALHIRDARAEDREARLALTLAAYAEYEASMGDHWEDYQQGLRTRFDGGVATPIVAERDGELVGSVLLYPAGSSAPAPDGSIIDFPEPEVGLLSVPPALRGQGIGRALMDECARRARAASADVLTLHTMDMMLGAMEMYERIGFVRDPAHDFSPAPHVTVRSYRLSLADQDDPDVRS
jgi:GNAT superfamily N-acetyltransferase